MHAHAVLNAASIHREVLTAVQADRANERSEFDRIRWSVGDVEECIPGLGMQVQVPLRRASVRAVVGEVAQLATWTPDAPIGGPPLQLIGQHVVDGRHVGDGESS